MSELEFGQRLIRRLADDLRAGPGHHLDLPEGDDPSSTAGLSHHGAVEAQTALRHGVELLAEYQDRLAAQASDAVLVVLQGPDASGKDGTIKHVMSGVNPQGVDVHSFRPPSEEDLGHDYLWRYSRLLPVRGRIGIFNRSHYEEVLVVRVHPELLEPQHLPHDHHGDGFWSERFRQINDWERYLVENGIHLVKLFLNLSREEQRSRLLARLEQPEKNWKFTAADLHERGRWDDFQRAYGDMLRHTSTRWAPWYVIPADHKWVARIAAAAIIADTLVRLDPQYPTVASARREELVVARSALLAESSGSAEKPAGR